MFLRDFIPTDPHIYMEISSSPRNPFKGSIGGFEKVPPQVKYPLKYPTYDRESPS